VSAASPAAPPPALRSAAAAIVSGSGLAVVPDGVEVVDEIAYERLGWPVTAVGGHPNRLRVGRWAGDGPLVLLCCGRPHAYEGWQTRELRRPVDDLAAWGVRHLVSTNACGALARDLDPGAAVVVDEIVDLQAAPYDAIPRLGGTDGAFATAAVSALEPFLPVRRGRYAAVAGPTYETPTQAAWLSRLADVVGMSTAPEAAAAGDHRLEYCALSLVVNRSAAPVGHDEVLAAGARLERALRPALAALLHACWPTEFGAVPSGGGAGAGRGGDRERPPAGRADDAVPQAGDGG
jgi:purine-nucleoside phosphorylase